MDTDLASDRTLYPAVVGGQQTNFESRFAYAKNRRIAEGGVVATSNKPPPVSAYTPLQVLILYKADPPTRTKFAGQFQEGKPANPLI